MDALRRLSWRMSLFFVVLSVASVMVGGIESLNRTVFSVELVKGV